MTYCINCGAEIPVDAEICTECGVNQATQLTGSHGERDPDQVYCVDCGELIYRQAEICPACEARQPSGGSQKDTDQVAAGILAILLGGLGVHKFYQGNTRNGVLYLCFFWTGIPTVLGLVEGILILIADETEYQRKYANGSILGR